MKKKMTKNFEEILAKLIPSYEANKSQMDAYKKVVDKDNKEIKKIMKEADLTQFEVDGIRATYSVSTRQDFNEESLIEKLKEMKIRGVIKKKEYVDMEALENAIYSGKVNASELSTCQTKKEVVTLRVSKID